MQAGQSVHPTLRLHPRPGKDQRHAHRAVKHVALEKAAEIAQQVAVVGSVDDDGVLQQAALAEEVHDTADIVVLKAHQSEVVGAGILHRLGGEPVPPVRYRPGAQQWVAID